MFFVSGHGCRKACLYSGGLVPQGFVLFSAILIRPHAEKCTSLSDATLADVWLCKLFKELFPFALNFAYTSFLVLI